MEATGTRVLELKKAISQHPIARLRLKSCFHCHWLSIGCIGLRMRPFSPDPAKTLLKFLLMMLGVLLLLSLLRLSSHSSGYVCRVNVHTRVSRSGHRWGPGMATSNSHVVAMTLARAAEEVARAEATRVAAEEEARVEAERVAAENWPGVKRQSIMRGLDFLQSMGEQLFRNEQLAAKHGPDLMLPFYIPPASAKFASTEERHALRVATSLAQEWRKRVSGISRYMPPRVPAAELLNLMQGLYSLDMLGIGDPVLHAQLHERAGAWRTADFLKYDPAAGEPPSSVRERCVCSSLVPEGAAECPSCRRPAVPMSPFDTWLEALIWTFHGCRMRIGLGACFFDVLRQVCNAFGRLYPRRHKLSEKDRHYLTYALTHVIYALNNFDERSLEPSLFPPMVPAFLREQLHAAMKADDPDLAGELLDCLKCLGQGGDASTTAAEKFLVARQSVADGGWVCKGEADRKSTL